MDRLVVVFIAGVFAGVALGCIGYVVATYTVAFGAPRRLWPVALRELGATLLLVLLWPLWWLLGASYELAEEGRGKRTPVILLHGFAMNHTQWIWLGRRLIRRGVGPLYSTSYFSPQAVARSARHLQKLVTKVLVENDAERVDIVAHSLGGVVARYYIEQMGGAEHVNRLVTLGSPHKGTRLARVGLVPVARELTEESELLAGLRPHAHVKYASIWSRADAIIMPPESSSVAPHGTDRVFDDLGHLSMLLSPRVADTIVELLGESA